MPRSSPAGGARNPTPCRRRYTTHGLRTDAHGRAPDVDCPSAVFGEVRAAERRQALDGVDVGFRHGRLRVGSDAGSRSDAGSSNMIFNCARVARSFSGIARRGTDLALVVPDDLLALGEPVGQREAIIYRERSLPLAAPKAWCFGRARSYLCRGSTCWTNSRRDPHRVARFPQSSDAGGARVRIRLLCAPIVPPSLGRSDSSKAAWKMPATTK